jgi:uncharacterized repeat protein (TIGR03837 family)
MGQQRWDVFCKVVDNFGDIGVSWRLARQLTREHGIAARLWVDDLATFERLRPGLEPDVPVQTADGVEVRRWTTDADLDGCEPGDVVVEAFGSRTPDRFVEAMARRGRQPVWINLEYLSAEAWVEDCHGLTSPHPHLPIVKHFFFPGFTARTGGLLREADLEARREAHMGALEPRTGHVTTASLFGYGGPSVGSLLSAWADGGDAMLALVPESRLLPDVEAFFGVERIGPGDRLDRGALSLLVLPFQPQDRYDQLLWECDCNFVRGEDSFVRAQWARRPFVWQLYPQEGAAHWPKMHAFVDRYAAGLAADVADAVREFWRLWNRGETSARVLGRAWERFWSHRDTLAAHADQWVRQVAELGDLAGNLVRFAGTRV